MYAISRHRITDVAAIRRGLMFAVTVALTTLGMAPESVAAEAPAKPVGYSVEGVDVSKHQHLAASQINQSEVLQRAKEWLTANNGKPVPYSHFDKWGGYRQDCSGYVAMAAKLPDRDGGPDTPQLFNHYTEAVDKSGMAPGDLFLNKEGTNDERHVVIFEKWANAEHTSYWAYEQRGIYGTSHRKLTYGLNSGTKYQARRLKNVIS